ncbi:hypothetical protein GYA44_02025 [Candidatus Microgenomates bacterium]|nr:hypothetical protein [Candidatus Microgenomates bacterium]
MIIKHKLLETYNDYRFSIPYKLGDRVLVETGSRITDGTPLIESRSSHRKNSFFVPEQIGCTLKEVLDTLTCIDGEFVQKGETLAQKISSGGLSVKKLVAPSAGIVDLARIENGYIDLLGEENTSDIVSNFTGEVESSSLIEGLVINSSAVALDLISISDIFDIKENNKEKKIVGEFVSLSEGKDLRLHSTEESYQNKIVFVGKYLHIDLLHDLFQKGASFVLTYSMNYEDFRRQGLPVGIIGGFGEIHSSSKLLSTISAMNGRLAVVDYSESQLFFIQDIVDNLKSNNTFLSNLNGATVKSLLLSNYGMVGQIQSVEEEGYVSVIWENGSSSMVNLGGVEFITF